MVTQVVSGVSFVLGPIVRYEGHTNWIGSNTATEKVRGHPAIRSVTSFYIFSRTAGAINEGTGNFGLYLITWETGKRREDQGYKKHARAETKLCLQANIDPHAASARLVVSIPFMEKFWPWKRWMILSQCWFLTWLGPQRQYSQKLTAFFSATHYCLHWAWWIHLSADPRNIPKAINGRWYPYKISKSTWWFPISTSRA